MMIDMRRWKNFKSARDTLKTCETKIINGKYEVLLDVSKNYGIVLDETSLDILNEQAYQNYEQAAKVQIKMAQAQAKESK